MTEIPMYLVHTGGTIVTNIKGIGKGLQIGKNSSSLFSHYINKYSMSEIQLFNILSENLDLEHMHKLTQCISTLEDHSAIFILHGTDRITLSAKYVLLHTPKYSKKKIFFIGSQRSPQMPTFEGYGKLECAITCYDKVLPGVYILNYVSPVLYQLLDPLTSIKTRAYDKNCFVGVKNYECDRVGNVLKFRAPRKFYGLNPSKIAVEPRNIQIMYPLPGTDLIVNSCTTHVIVNGTGLCNVHKLVDQLIKEHPLVKFYVANDLDGLKYAIYDVESINNKIIVEYTVETTYLQLIYGAI